MVSYVSECPKFLRLNNIPLYVYTIFCWFFYDLWNLKCFHLLIFVYIVLLWSRCAKLSSRCSFYPFGYKPINGIAESCANSVLNIFRNCWATLFYQNTQQHTIRIIILPHPHQHLLFPRFLKIVSIIIDVRQIFSCGFDLHFSND